MASHEQADTESRIRRSRLPGSSGLAQIVAAARQVFTQVGYSAASMGEISEAAGITKPALYRHFGDKQSLYAAVLEVVGDDLAHAIVNAASGQSSREEKAAAAVHACFEALIEGGVANLLMASDAQDDPSVGSAVDKVWQSAADRILRVVALRGKRSDQAELDVFGTILARTLGAIPVLLSDSDSRADRSTVERLVKEMVRSSLPGPSGGADQAALIELDNGDARAREGYRHLIQHVVPAVPRVVHAVPVSIYLESGTAAAEVESAVLEVLVANEIVVAEVRGPVIGSWFRLMLGRTKKALTSEQMADTMTRLERAIELQVLHKPQAEINSAELDGVAKLIAALGQEQNACVQLGSVFLLKVDGNIVSRNVSQREMAFLERNSGLLGTPREVLAALERAAHGVETADNVSIEDGAVRLSLRQPDDRGRVGLTVSVGDGVATVYEVGFDVPASPVPVSSGVTHVQAHHDMAVIRAEGVTITVRRLSAPAKQYQLVVAAENGPTTSYELDFTRPRGA
ncbi:TetR/AcrR family transcriptional regulator [Amycolatopsis sp. NPDC051071]|uniref:TetR/AcrR family transcriptional regulator n=1 Tax=Amycolatopsis sp. NPDC051071 TaxID=3154637 RepID=UPI00342BF92F